MIFSNLNIVRSQLHPRLYEALRELDEGKAPGVRYDLLAALAVEDGTALRIECAFRSWDEQDRILADQDPRNPVTLVGGGKSLHQWGLAADVVIRISGYGPITVDGKSYAATTPEVWRKLGIPQFYASRGLTWGGNWTRPVDPSHVELDIPHPTEREYSGSAWWIEEEEEAPMNKPKIVFPWALVIAGVIAWAMLRPKLNPKMRLA